MSRFTQPLVVVPLSELRRAAGEDVRRHDARSWVLYTDDFVYEVGAEGSGETVAVPRGFVTDFASVPRLLWFFVAPWGRHGPAAVLHDYGYWLQDPPDRRYWDHVFDEAMRVLEVHPWTRRLLFLAVRWFGGFAWRSAARARRPDRIVDVVGAIRRKKP